jgi:ribose 5-phosphate isomerase
MNTDEMKRNAALDSLSFLKDGMILGVGTGSTVEIFIEELIKRKKEFPNIVCVSSSNKTKNILEKNNFKVVDLDDRVDLYIDGADAADYNLILIKGGGGALTREKIVAYNSKKVIIIVDETKIKNNPFEINVPVEILQFSWKATKRRIEELGYRAILRTFGNETFVTDNGNFILDVDLSSSKEPLMSGRNLKNIPGVIETGIFENLADILIIGQKNGKVKRISKIA